MSVLNKQFEFSERDLTIVQHFAIQLRSIPIFETQRIQNMLTKIDQESLELKRWKEEVFEAVMDWDNARLQALLEYQSA